MIKNTSRLWAISSAVWPGKGFRAIRQRLQFVGRALTAYSAVRPFLEARQDSSLGKLMSHRPETIGAVVWPYQCSGWNARTRLERIRQHYSIIEKWGGRLAFPSDGQLVLLDLPDIRQGLRVIIDGPKWFMREGELSINLFINEERIFSLAFSLTHQNGSHAAFVGGIQGRDIEGALVEYRELTKATHGMRPRDFLIELFRMFCSKLGVKTIFAVSDAYRHHRHPYFAQASKMFFNNYDEIWSDRGGSRVDPMYFEFAVDARWRDLDTVPAKKRAMYRRRYEMLERISRQIDARLDICEQETEGGL